MSQRLIDPSALERDLEMQGKLTLNLMCIISEQPTIDAVHAAGGCYCRECKRWKPDGGYGLDLDGTKRLYGACDITHYHHKENHFCGNGKRREKP